MFPSSSHLSPGAFMMLKALKNNHLEKGGRTVLQTPTQAASVRRSSSLNLGEDFWQDIENEGMSMIQSISPLRSCGTSKSNKDLKRPKRKKLKKTLKRRKLDMTDVPTLSGDGKLVKENMSEDVVASNPSEVKTNRKTKEVKHGKRNVRKRRCQAHNEFVINPKEMAEGVDEEVFEAFTSVKPIRTPENTEKECVSVRQVLNNSTINDVDLHKTFVEPSRTHKSTRLKRLMSKIDSIDVKRQKRINNGNKGLENPGDQNIVHTATKETEASYINISAKRNNSTPVGLLSTPYHVDPQKARADGGRYKTPKSTSFQRTRARSDTFEAKRQKRMVNRRKSLKSLVDPDEKSADKQGSQRERTPSQRGTPGISTPVVQHSTLVNPQKLLSDSRKSAWSSRSTKVKVLIAGFEQKRLEHIHLKRKHLEITGDEKAGPGNITRAKDQQVAYQDMESSTSSPNQRRASTNPDKDTGQQQAKSHREPSEQTADVSNSPELHHNGSNFETPKRQRIPTELMCCESCCCTCKCTSLRKTPATSASKSVQTPSSVSKGVQVSPVVLGLESVRSVQELTQASSATIRKSQTSQTDGLEVDCETAQETASTKSRFLPKDGSPVTPPSDCKDKPRIVIKDISINNLYKSPLRMPGQSKHTSKRTPLLRRKHNQRRSSKSAGSSDSGRRTDSICSQSSLEEATKLTSPTLSPVGQVKTTLPTSTVETLPSASPLRFMQFTVNRGRRSVKRKQTRKLEVLFSSSDESDSDVVRARAAVKRFLHMNEGCDGSENLSGAFEVGDGESVVATSKLDSDVRDADVVDGGDADVVDGGDADGRGDERDGEGVIDGDGSGNEKCGDKSADYSDSCDSDESGEDGDDIGDERDGGGGVECNDGGDKEGIDESDVDVRDSGEKGFVGDEEDFVSQEVVKGHVDLGDSDGGDGDVDAHDSDDDGEEGVVKGDVGDFDTSDDEKVSEERIEDKDSGRQDDGNDSTDSESDMDACGKGNDGEEDVNGDIGDIGDSDDSDDGVHTDEKVGGLQDDGNDSSDGESNINACVWDNDGKEWVKGDVGIVDDSNDEKDSEEHEAEKSSVHCADDGGDEDSIYESGVDVLDNIDEEGFVKDDGEDGRGVGPASEDCLSDDGSGVSSFKAGDSSNVLNGIITQNGFPDEDESKTFQKDARTCIRIKNSSKCNQQSSKSKKRSSRDDVFTSLGEESCSSSESVTSSDPYKFREETQVGKKEIKDGLLKKWISAKKNQRSSTDDGVEESCTGSKTNDLKKSTKKTKLKQHLNITEGLLKERKSPKKRKLKKSEKKTKLKQTVNIKEGSLKERKSTQKSTLNKSQVVEKGLFEKTKSKKKLKLKKSPRIKTRLLKDWQATDGKETKSVDKEHEDDQTNHQENTPQDRQEEEPHQDKSRVYSLQGVNQTSWQSHLDWTNKISSLYVTKDDANRVLCESMITPMPLEWEEPAMSGTYREGHRNVLHSVFYKLLFAQGTKKRQATLVSGKLKIKRGPTVIEQRKAKADENRRIKKLKAEIESDGWIEYDMLPAVYTESNKKSFIREIK